jgi:hypothetical protein
MLDRYSDSMDSQTYQIVVSALRQLPNNCVADLDELVHRIGADKLEVIQWSRADITFAYLVDSKLVK